MIIKNEEKSFWRNPPHECNCGSFALNVKKNYCPYNHNEAYTEDSRLIMIEDLLCDGLTRQEVMDIVLERDWEEILKTCDWIEPIEYKDIQPEDRVIAYRLCLVLDDYGELWDDDFHFRVRIGGFWFEKNGSYPIRFCGDSDQLAPWVSTDSLIYDSSIKYGRFKKV